MAFNKDKFKYVDHTPKSTEVREIIAIGEYLGSVVKGSAKCDPADTFDANTGETLAALRCNLKIAEKRFNHASNAFETSQAVLAKASSKAESDQKYFEHASAELEEAQRLLDEFYQTLY
jgi:hypothetical protein